MRTRVALACLLWTQSPAFAQPPIDTQTIGVGPWGISSTYKADRFEGCGMSRMAAGLDIVFIRNADGLSLSLESAKWKLERGKTYTVRLVAGSRAVEAKALAEAKAVTIALADRPFGESLRLASTLEVRGEGATLRVPLDGSAAALDRLDSCYEKNSRSSAETNPFVAPPRRP